jgi:ABC-type lipoprotein release transport system permease subunit
MASALGFAMSAEVKAQEKSLAILRAFGVSGIKVASIFQLRTFIQLAYATAISGIVFWALKIYLESIINDQPWATGFNLTLGISDLIVPVLLTFLITQFVTISVVLIWSQKNRYVAEKLQGL